jgi:uncharacterized membrane protein YeaQ/YmgE (transglycosylase-associated protein family)
MDLKRMGWIGVFVGSTIGSYVPVLWGGSLLSLSSIVLSAVGAILGIYVAYKLSQW